MVNNMYKAACQANVGEGCEWGEKLIVDNYEMNSLSSQFMVKHHGYFIQRFPVLLLVLTIMENLNQDRVTGTGTKFTLSLKTIKNTSGNKEW